MSAKRSVQSSLIGDVVCDPCDFGPTESDCGHCEHCSERASSESPDSLQTAATLSLIELNFKMCGSVALECSEAALDRWFIDSLYGRIALDDSLGWERESQSFEALIHNVLDNRKGVREVHGVHGPSVAETTHLVCCQSCHSLWQHQKVWI